MAVVETESRGGMRPPTLSTVSAVRAPLRCQSFRRRTRAMQSRSRGARLRHRIESGEELELIPSHLFYLSGCDLRCAFCIAEENAFDPRRGTPLTVDFLREAIEWSRSRGDRNIQWVGGEPTIHIPAILDACSACPWLPPIVWKSDFYGTPEAFDLLRGFVNVYVADLKFGQDHCAPTNRRCRQLLRGRHPQSPPRRGRERSHHSAPAPAEPF